MLTLGSGKTTLLCNLLKFYAGYFHNIYVVSPTVKNDEKWLWVKKQKLLSENLPLRAFLKQLEDKKRDENKVVGEAPKGGDPLLGHLHVNTLAGGKERKKSDKFDGKIPEACFMNEYTPEELRRVLDEKQKVIDLLEANGKTKHLADRDLWLFDDLVGSSLFSSSRDNPFKMLNTNHRHMSISIMMVSQAFKEIPKTVRTQFSCLIIFEIFSDSEVEAICNEFPMGLKKEAWYEMYHYCTGTPHSFLFYNIQRSDPDLRVMKNFDQVVFYRDKK